MKTNQLILAVCLILASPVTMAAELGQFEQIETKTFDKKKFVFPDDVAGAKVHVLFLSLSADMDNGVEQMNAMFEWQAALDERGVFNNDDIKAYHFSVAAGVPFFVKGMMGRSMRKSHDGKTPPERSGVLYVDDVEQFAGAAGIEADGRPTIVLVSAAGSLQQVFKGTVTDDGLEELIVAIDAMAAE